MQSLTEFKFHTHSIRVFPTEDGISFWAVAADVAKVLGYADAKDFTRAIPDNHKGRKKIPTLGGPQEMLIVDEPGMYCGVLRSNKPEAEPFVKWVTEEILPSIRRTGGYIHPAASDSLKAQLALAQEVGALLDQIADRERLIVAKDKVIVKLLYQANRTQRNEIRLLKEVGRFNKRLTDTATRELVILMESQGHPRVDIAARCVKTLKQIRDIVYDARRAGRLPQPQAELDLQ